MNINQYNDIKNLLKAFDLPTKLPKYINIEDLFKAMLIDKKVKNNKMVYVLPNGIGDSYITNKITKIMVIKALKQHAE
jgi:3-dehydroquinate synthase